MTHQDFVRELQSAGLQVQVYENLKFSLKEKRRKRYTKERALIMLSLFDLEESKRQVLQKIYDQFRLHHLSFPIKERSKHLMVHFREHIFNFGYWPIPYFSQFRVWPSRLPNRATIEPLLPLTDFEESRMALYIDNIKKKKTKVIGRFHNEGYQETRNQLEDNRPLAGGHNCSSWVATAPISSENRSLIEELGGGREHLYGTNPGWWTSWLLSSANRDVSAIYWDVLPLEKMKKRIDEDGFFVWDFNRH